MEFEAAERNVGWSFSGRHAPAKGKRAKVAAEIAELTNCRRERSLGFDM
jgi:hypothetical protein